MLSLSRSRLSKPQRVSAFNAKTILNASPVNNVVQYKVYPSSCKVKRKVVEIGGVM